MPAALKERLEREADINRRSVNSEIVNRLEESVNAEVGDAAPRKLKEPEAIYSRLTDAERAMLAVFKTLPPEKQLALLSLFK